MPPFGPTDDAALPLAAISATPLRTSTEAPRASLPVAELPGPAAAPGRWSASAWALLRRDAGPGLAPGGTLGGSQAGIRIGYRLNDGAARPLTLVARFHAPLRDRRASEAAIGLDWRPLRGVPVRLVAERRQALGANGRSAFAVGAHGGVSAARLPGGLRLDAYGQAGIVGTRSRDLYADGAARLSLAAGRLEVGAGAWGGAQPGAARFDAGPQIGLRLLRNVRISAEWRFRIAGDAAPGSGPALTIGSDF